MEDLLFVLATVGFFALAAAYVRFCDRVIGPDPAPQAALADEQTMVRSS